MKAEIFWIAADLPGRLAVMPRPRRRRIGFWMKWKSWRAQGR